MFGNLVLIEIIRLYKSVILRISGLIAIFLLFLMTLIGELVVQMGGVEMMPYEDATPIGFKVVMFDVVFQGLAMVVAGMTVAFTTCSYYKNRLAVNIEGAVRSHLKLCLAEICGIIVFVMALNLLVFPGVAVILAGNPSDIALLFANNLGELKDIYLFSCMASLFGSMTVYVLSKIIHNAPVAVILSMFVELLAMILVFFMTGFIKGYEDAGGTLVLGIEDMLCTLVMILPMTVLGIIAFIRNKKADRI